MLMHLKNHIPILMDRKVDTLYETIETTTRHGQYGTESQLGNEQEEAVDLYKLPLVFISDRDKGIAKSLKDIYSDNVSCIYAFHIKQNVVSWFGVAVGDKVMDLANTFSETKADNILDHIWRTKPGGYRYIDSIDPEK